MISWILSPIGVLAILAVLSFSLAPTNALADRSSGISPEKFYFWYILAFSLGTVVIVFLIVLFPATQTSTNGINFWYVSNLLNVMGLTAIAIPFMARHVVNSANKAGCLTLEGLWQFRYKH